MPAVVSGIRLLVRWSSFAPVTWVHLITVYAVGVLELWGAVPAGLALGLAPVVVGVVSALGAWSAAILVLVAGEPFRRWLLSLRKQSVDRPQGRLGRVWQKYGIAGLCLISPLLLGAHIGAALCLALGGAKRPIAVWMLVSCVLWSAILTTLGALGIAAFGGT